jgi:hypothetical protein
MGYEEDEGGEEFAGAGAAVPDSSESVPTKRKRYFKRTLATVSFIRSKSAFSFGTSSTLAERWLLQLRQSLILVFVAI